MPGFDTPWHFHPEIELTCIVRGDGQRFVGDSIETFGPGDLVLLGPNLPHYWCSSTRPRASSRMSHSLVIQFLDDFLGIGFLEVPELHRVGRLLDRASRGVLFLGKERELVPAKMETMRDRTGAARLAALLEVLDLLSLAADHRPLAGVGYVPNLDMHAGERISRCYDFVMSNLSEPIRLSEAATAAGMSPEGFCRYFKKVMGKTFFEFVNEVRIGQACRLLEVTDQTISEIAFACGYGTLSNFNRRFRTLRRTTPSRYRQRGQS